MQRLIEFSSNNLLLVVALFTIIGIIVFTELKRLNRAFKDVSPSEAVRLINHENAVLLDIREPGEVTKNKIAGAKHIPLSNLKQRLAELEKHRDQTVIAYCRSGARSAQACDLLTKSEFEKVYNLKGGIMAWENEALPIAKV